MLNYNGSRLYLGAITSLLKDVGNFLKTATHFIDPYYCLFNFKHSKGYFLITNYCAKLGRGNAKGK